MSTTGLEITDNKLNGTPKYQNAASEARTTFSLQLVAQQCCTVNWPYITFIMLMQVLIAFERRRNSGEKWQPEI